MKRVVKIGNASFHVHKSTMMLSHRSYRKWQLSAIRLLFLDPTGEVRGVKPSGCRYNVVQRTDQRTYIGLMTAAALLALFGLPGAGENSNSSRNAIRIACISSILLQERSHE